MQWYKDIKMSLKLILAFLLVAVISAVGNVIGIIRILNMENTGFSDVWIMISITIICFITSLILGISIARFLAMPLNVMSEVAEKLARGDTQIEVSQAVNSKDEMGKLADAFRSLIISTQEQTRFTQRLSEGDLSTNVTVRSNQDELGKGLTNLVESLNELATSIISSSNRVASGANLVSESSFTLSQGATQQASSVEELTASVEEISRNTSINAQKAETACDLTVKARTDAENSKQMMHSMLQAMDDINVSSGHINKIINVIDSITFQTNILALNAAVEAARAGQHGKGFAVVAEEVRTLAAKSSKAAKEITDMIESSIRNVEAGISIANETASALLNIVEEVTNVADLVSSISSASKEQAMSIKQLNQGISLISQVVQSNAATSEECAAASDELAGQANHLKDVVSVFKVKDAHVFDTKNLYLSQELVYH